MGVQSVQRDVGVGPIKSFAVHLKSSSHTGESKSESKKAKNTNSKIKMPEILAEEISQDAAPVNTATESADPCAEIIKAKELCLAEGGDCAELMKSFEECMNKAQS